MCKRGNLEGFTADDEHFFTWQPHGSQFTIIENLPEKRLAIRLKQPPSLDRDLALETIGFDNWWVEIL